jgi:hypothetical protein
MDELMNRFVLNLRRNNNIEEFEKWRQLLDQPELRHEFDENIE